MPGTVGVEDDRGAPPARPQKRMECTMLKIECSPCGETLFATDEAELVRLTAQHARAEHGVELFSEEILAMAQPAR